MQCPFSWSPVQVLSWWMGLLDLTQVVPLYRLPSVCPRSLGLWMSSGTQRPPDVALSAVCRSPPTLLTHSPRAAHAALLTGWICMQMEVLPVLYLLGPGWDFLIPDVWPLHSSGSSFPLTPVYHLEIRVITASLWPLSVCSFRPIFTEARCWHSVLQ